MFVPNLVFLTHPSLQILGKTQTGVFQISGFLVNPLRKKIAITPEPVNVLNIKLGLVTKLGKRNKTRSKKLDNDAMLENCDAIF